MSLAVTAANRCVTTKWNHGDPPDITQWINEVNLCCKLPLEAAYSCDQDDLYGVRSLCCLTFHYLILIFMSMSLS